MTVYRWSENKIIANQFPIKLPFPSLAGLWGSRGCGNKSYEKTSNQITSCLSWRGRSAKNNIDNGAEGGISTHVLRGDVKLPSPISFGHTKKANLVIRLQMGMSVYKHRDYKNGNISIKFPSTTKANVGGNERQAVGVGKNRLPKYLLRIVTFYDKHFCRKIKTRRELLVCERLSICCPRNKNEQHLT